MTQQYIIPANYNYNYSSPTYVSPAVSAMKSGGIAGAVIGGVVSAAKNLSDVKADKISKDTAIKNTLKDAAGTGVATATGLFAARTLGLGTLGSLLVFAGTAAGTKYAWDNMTQNQK